MKIIKRRFLFTAYPKKEQKIRFAGYFVHHLVDPCVAVACNRLYRTLYLSPVAAVLVLAAGLWMLYGAVQLYRKGTDKSAKTLMLISVTYISLMQIIFILDKFLR